MTVEGVAAQLRYRIVRQSTGAVITEDLPHPHQSSWTVLAHQPGAPATATLGSFTIPLFSIWSDEGKAAYTVYQSIGFGDRVEGYVTVNGLSLSSAPRYAGIITNVDLLNYTLSGDDDLHILAAQRFFPGEKIATLEARTDRALRAALGQNQLGFYDYAPANANYNQTAYPGSAGMPTVTYGTTDLDGIACVKMAGAAANPTFSGFVWSKSSYPTSKDSIRKTYAEVTGYYTPPAAPGHAQNMGVFNVVLAFPGGGTAGSNLFIAGAILFRSPDAGITIVGDVMSYNVNNGVGSTFLIQSGAFGPIPYSTQPIKLQVGIFGNATSDRNALAVTVGGRTVVFNTIPLPVMDPSFGIGFDAGFVGSSATFAASSAQGGMVGLSRTDDYGAVGTAIIKQGSTTATGSRSFQTGADMPLTLYDQIARCASAEGWQYRYTPQPYAAGVLGAMDYGTSVGTDRSNSVIFTEGHNLEDVAPVGPAEGWASDLVLATNPTTDGYGQVFVRNVPAMVTYGVMTDSEIQMTSADWATLARSGALIAAAKGSPTQALKATVIRDPDTADVWRELDYVTIDSPTRGINHQRCLVLAYTFQEGSVTQELTLDQYGADMRGVLSARRVVEGAVTTVSKFANR